MHQMLDCGRSNVLVCKILKEFLPASIISSLKDTVVIISTTDRDACQIPNRIHEKKDIILLSERIFPKIHAEWDSDEFIYFAFVLLHEIAHAVKKHKSPLLANLSNDEVEKQESEATTQAMIWYNSYVDSKCNQYLKPLTIELVEEMKQRNQTRMMQLYS